MLDVDGWEDQFYVKNTHRYIHFLRARMSDYGSSKSEKFYSYAYFGKIRKKNDAYYAKSRQK